MDSWKIEFKDFSGKKIDHPFMNLLLSKQFSSFSQAQKEALQAIKRYPPFVRVNLVNVKGQSVSLIDERWHFRPLVLDLELATYFVKQVDIEYFVAHISARQRMCKLPQMALSDPIKFWAEYLLGAKIYVDYRRKDDPSPLKTYKLYVLKEIQHDKKRLWEAVFDLNYTLHRNIPLYTHVFDYHFDLKFKTLYDVEKSRTLKNIKDKRIQQLNLRFQWHVRFLTEQLEEARLAAFEDEICNYTWNNASPEDKKIANVLVPIFDFSIHLEQQIPESLEWLASAASRLIDYFYCINNDKEIFNAGGRWLTEKEKSLWISLNDKERSSLAQIVQKSGEELLEEDLLLLCNVYSRKVIHI